MTAFLALVLVNTFVPLPDFVGEAGNAASRWGLLAAIAAVGVKTQFREVIEIGWKPVLLMILETLFIAALALIAIAGGWI